MTDLRKRCVRGHGTKREKNIIKLHDIVQLFDSNFISNETHIKCQRKLANIQSIWWHRIIFFLFFVSSRFVLFLVVVVFVFYFHLPIFFFFCSKENKSVFIIYLCKMYRNVYLYTYASGSSFHFSFLFSFEGKINCKQSTLHYTMVFLFLLFLARRVIFSFFSLKSQAYFSSEIGQA